MGFGGIAKLSDTTLPVNPELILCEQLRLKSSVGWLGRSFRDSLDRKNISLSLQKEVSIIRNFLRDYTQAPKDFFDLKHIELLEQIHLMKNQMK